MQKSDLPQQLDLFQQLQKPVSNPSNKHSAPSFIVLKLKQKILRKAARENSKKRSSCRVMFVGSFPKTHWVLQKTKQNHWVIMYIRVSMEVIVSSFSKLITIYEMYPTNLGVRTSKIYYPFTK